MRSGKLRHVAMRITPSILNADLADLAGEVAKVPSSDMIHFDVMDNHFVPNLTLGLPVVESLRKHTTTPIDAHLMIEDADTWAPPPDPKMSITVPSGRVRPAMFSTTPTMR